MPKERHAGLAEQPGFEDQRIVVNMLVVLPKDYQRSTAHSALDVLPQQRVLSIAEVSDGEPYCPIGDGFVSFGLLTRRVSTVVELITDTVIGKQFSNPVMKFHSVVW
ncbi:hypothetical protein [Devosia sp.]|uniref:hypothetical protein n=1 Tax=Devosia sp. TaxID=1871048 RepID=UPI002931CE1C|nr:hypothetical protein [Devosia sp.]